MKRADSVSVLRFGIRRSFFIYRGGKQFFTHRQTRSNYILISVKIRFVMPIIVASSPQHNEAGVDSKCITLPGLNFPISSEVVMKLDAIKSKKISYLQLVGK